MAKPAVPGRVKTRMIGEMTAHHAAEVHAAMLGCVLQRLRDLMVSPDRDVAVTHVLALDGFDGDSRAHHDAVVGMDLGMGLAVPPGWRVVDQGTGDLGDRLDHVWRAVAGDTGDLAAVFFGVDSPDVPSNALRSALQAVAGPGPAADAAVGPVEDGGYWTLAGRRRRRELLTGIDWGTPAVYDQTLAAGRAAGLNVASLPPWFDVDDAAGLAALRDRLSGGQPAAPQDPALAKLSDRLDRICGDNRRA